MSKSYSKTLSLKEVSHIDFAHKKRQFYVWGWGGGGGGELLAAVTRRGKIR